MTDWIGTVASATTALAFVLAAITFFRSERSRRQAQARLVWSRLEPRMWQAGQSIPPSGAPVSVVTPDVYRDLPGQASEGIVPEGRAALQALVTVVNDSAEVVGPVLVQLVDASNGGRYGGPREIPQGSESWMVQSVEPGGEAVCSITVLSVGGAAYPSILFRDASGRWWRRIAHGPVEWVHDDPANIVWNHPARVPTMKRREKFWSKWPPRQTPKASTLLWRLWRRVTGKSAIP